MLTDLVLDPATGVSIDPASARNLRYLDGTGPYLDGLFRGTDDLGSGSEVLLGQASSWPLIYHVSPHRWSLLDCIGLPGRACTVLELGAGCGSVARWLGERFSDVRAIEGVPLARHWHEAAAAASRVFTSTRRTSRALRSTTSSTS